MMLQIQDFLAVCRRMPLLDVRSPAEFAKGHIPGAVSISLFSDSERAEVGTLYTQVGREAAVLHGLAVAGPKLEALAREALALVPDAPGTKRKLAVTCWRGGMRSASVAWLLEQAGITVHRLQGGYKAYRAEVQRIFALPYKLLVLGGMTGGGKTELLHQLREQGSQMVDLEGLARHRGSVFGLRSGDVQPSTEHFENLLHQALAACDPARDIWVEDESENLGTVNIPHAFLSTMKAAPWIMLDVPAAERLERVLAYYDPACNDFASEGIRRIRKRLGDEQCSRALAALQAEEYTQAAAILLDYYDRAYAKQLARRAAPLCAVACTQDEAMTLRADRLLAAVRTGTKEGA